MSEVQQHHVPFGHTPADGSNADQMAELASAKGCGAAGGHTGALYQDWTVIGIDPERVGAGPPDQHISRPGAVFTESWRYHLGLLNMTTGSFPEGFELEERSRDKDQHYARDYR